MRKNLFFKVWAILLLSFAGLTNAHAQFLENTDKVDIVQIRGFDGENVGLWYLADIGTDTDSIVWSQEATDVIKWYRIPAGGASDGTADVQVYYYKNVATGRYLYITDDQLTELAGDDGEWPTKRAYATSTYGTTANYKWFERNTNADWGWASNLHSAAAYYPDKRDGNHYLILSGIIMMKIKDNGINGEEFFGVYEPNASVGSHAGGLGNAWHATKIEVAETNVANPDYRLDNSPSVDIIQIKGFDGENVGNWYLADLGIERDSIAWSQEITDITKWYRIPAGAAFDKVQAYYYKNVETGRYLYISDEQLAEFAGDDGDWPTKRAYATSENAKTANYKWVERNTNADWGWASNLHSAAAYYPDKKDGNHYLILSGIIMMKIKDNGINGENFYGVYEPNASVGSQAGGLGNAWHATKIEVVATVANPDYISNGLEYSIDRLNFFAHDGGEDANAASYNEDTHTITYNEGWRRAGWNWEAEDGIDVSGYNQVWIKYDASALPKTGDGEDGATKIQFDVVYTDDSNAADDNGKSNEVRSNDTEYFYNLTPGKKIKRITLKSEVAGNVVLTDAYFYNKGVDPVDLIVTDITWTPENPVLGDSILFSATIKNQSEFASPNVKHGLTFAVKAVGTAGNGTVVAYSDTHLTSLAPDEEVTLTASGNPGKLDNGKWKPAAARTFIVVVQVNDQNDIVETDITNNFLEKEIVIGDQSGIDKIAIGEHVFYVADSKLYLMNLPATATVSVYNLQAQKLGDYQASEAVSGLALPKNLYIVRIKDGAQSANLKVLVK
ncbi:MAG: hypothetical protein LBS25_01660 [Candidatus Symbiothrix sp.]|jgi:hypothetical protein|nr:hypothetical protein [Candidatus Symbiothrix sp.]